MLDSREESLEVSSSIALIARQLGAVLTNEQVENSYKSGELKQRKLIQDYFARYSISVFFKKIRKSDLIFKKYIFPCVALQKNSKATIILSAKTKPDSGKTFFQTIDVFSSTLGPKEVEFSEFLKSWTGSVVLVGKKSDIPSMDRSFDYDWFLPEIMRFKWLFAMAFVMSLIIHSIAFAPIIFIQISLDKVVGYQATATLYVLTIGVFCALVFSGIMGYLRDYIVSIFGAAIDARLSGDIFDKILRLPIHQIESDKDLKIESSTQAISSIKVFLTRHFLIAVFDIAGLLVFLPILFLYSTLLAFVVIGFAVTLGLLSFLFRNLEKKRSVNAHEEDFSKLKILRETVAGIDNVKALSQEQIQRRSWREASFKSINAALAKDQISAISTNLNSVIQQLMTITIIFVGIQLVFAGSLSAGAIIAVNMVAARVTRPVGTLITSLGEIDNAKLAISKISEIWNSTPERKSIGISVLLKGGYSFKDVELSLGGNKILKGVNFDIKAGSNLGLVGTAAAGKTTLLRVLQGFIRPTVGTILVDGRALNTLDLENYRSQVSMVNSSPKFFAGSIEDNLRRARRNISERELDDAVVSSCLEEVLPNIDGGMSHQLDSIGSSLPNSYKQIIAISRAIASNPKILLFDEVFSPLDKSLQAKLLSKLREIGKSKTLILVTHDLRLTKNFDEIIVMDNGAVVGHSSHSSLLSNNAVYQKLWQLDQLVQSTA
ncbi:MAG: hypothetical protein CBD16_08045 [Betaproteobacteria bacterium TMED156]|nr:MAG: hypothetical protein CBD16_08045 [Betaproteobacteria bacterium TMED156]